MVLHIHLRGGIMAGFTRRELGTLTLSALALGLAGCASGNGGGTTSTPSQGQASAGTSAAASAADWNAKGPINYAQGKDISGYVDTLLGQWNTAHPDQKVTLIELPADADQQRQRMIDKRVHEGLCGL
jgi:multiple sugar transport system substrate-binding protein